MIEWIVSFLGKTVGVDTAIILTVVYGANIALAGIQRGLEFIKDKTETKLDNKAYDAIAKIIKVLLKLIDVVGFNPQHK